MADHAVDMLLIGGGVASASCAIALRRGSGSESIMLVGRELDAPYHRPPCSKGYLSGDEDLEQVMVRPADWWEDNNVELLTRTSVVALDANNRIATLSNKQTVAFRKALIATGLNVRRIDLEGARLGGVHYLRTLRNADALARDAEEVERVVLIGGSYIGCEVAATLTTMGKRCTVVLQEHTPLQRGFGERAGRFVQRVLEDHDVEVLTETQAVALEGSGERVEAVRTVDGRRLSAELVVMGTGAVGDLTLARSAGLEIGPGGGVLTDTRLCSSVPGIYAAGDICEWPLPGLGAPARIEHWDVAFSHGHTAAANMLGDDQTHDVLPYFWSDLADWCTLRFVGARRGDEREVLRGSVEDGRFSLWYLDGRRLRAALSVGCDEDLVRAGRLIEAGRSVEAEHIADPTYELADL